MLRLRAVAVKAVVAVAGVRRETSARETTSPQPKSKKSEPTHAAGTALCHSAPYRNASHLHHSQRARGGNKTNVTS